MFTTETDTTSAAKASERSLLVRASRLYYLEERGQAEIARLLDVSRPSVSRLLSRARREGIVEIRIRGSEAASDWPALARKLALRELVVAETDGGGADLAKAAVGRMAAEWFTDHVRPGEAIGLTAGTTLSAFTHHVPHGLGLGLQIVPLVGALWDTGEDFDGSFLCQELRRRTGGTHLVLSAPAVVGTRALARSLRGEPRVRSVLESFAKLKHVFLGIGKAEVSHVIVAAARLSSRARSTRRKQRFLPKRAVASVGSLFFDAMGKPCRSALDGRTIGISHAELMAVSTRVGLAAGVEKLAPTLALVRGGVVNVLMVDEPLARALERQIKPT